MAYRPPTPEVQAGWDAAVAAEVAAINADEMDNPRQTYVVEDWADPFDPALQRHIKGSRYLKRGEFFLDVDTTANGTRTHLRIFLAMQDGAPMQRSDEGRHQAEHRYAGKVVCSTFAFAYEEDAVVTVEGLVCFRRELQTAAESWSEKALAAISEDSPPSAPQGVQQ
jgi:hypothetical protein